MMRGFGDLIMRIFISGKMFFQVPPLEGFREVIFYV